MKVSSLISVSSAILAIILAGFIVFAIGIKILEITFQESTTSVISLKPTLDSLYNVKNSDEVLHRGLTKAFQMHPEDSVYFREAEIAKWNIKQTDKQIVELLTHFRQ
jgi:hypothetical protein